MKLLTMKDVTERTTLSRSTIYNRINSGDFPRPIKLGDHARSARWVDTEIQKWILDQIKYRDKQQERKL